MACLIVAHCLATLPQALVAAIFMPIGGRFFDRIGARPLVVAGLLTASVALWLMTGLSASTTAADLRLPLALMGAAMGMMMMPLSTHVLNSAPRHLVSRVTSLSGALQQVVASLAIASYATYLQGRMATYLGGAGRGPMLGAEGAPAAGAAGGQLPPQVAEAMAHAFGDTYRIAMSLTVLAVLFALTLRRRPVAHGAAAETGEGALAMAGG